MHRLVIFLSIILITASGCERRGCTDPLANNYDIQARKDDGSCNFSTTCGTSSFCTDQKLVDGKYYNVITGRINTDFTMTSGYNWMLDEAVYVESGSILTIEPGTHIYGSPKGSAFLSVQRGAKIYACGTPEKPIVFTSPVENPESGLWGGLVINGSAPINNGLIAYGECGTGEFGGTDVNDNSGELCYVRVEYAGKWCTGELNGFTFNGVGKGTNLHHLQAYKCSDDGFEFFGGTAHIKYAISSGARDDGFDWTFGWQGRAQHLVVVQGDEGSDRGFEGDNNGNEHDLEPYSSPMISNVTMIIKERVYGTTTGVKLRAGTKGVFTNMLVKGPGVDTRSNGIEVNDSLTTYHMNLTALKVKNNRVFNFQTNWKNCDKFKNDPTNSSDPVMLNGYIGIEKDGARNPRELYPWFDPTEYIGAVSPDNDWTQGWVRAL